MCRWMAAKVLAWDRRRVLTPVPIQSPEGEWMLASVPEGERLNSWHLVEPDGTVHSAGAAFEPLFRLLPGAAPAKALAGVSPRLTERAYRLVAGNRGRIGPLIPDAAKARADRRIAERRLPGRGPG